MGLTHVDKDGKAKMVDISGKDVTLREAEAVGRVLGTRRGSARP